MLYKSNALERGMGVTSNRNSSGRIADSAHYESHAVVAVKP